MAFVSAKSTPAPTRMLFTPPAATPAARRYLAEIDKIAAAGSAIVGLGMRFNAGHALNFYNVQPIARLPAVRELHIGHAIVSRAVFHRAARVGARDEAPDARSRRERRLRAQACCTASAQTSSRYVASRRASRAWGRACVAHPGRVGAAGVPLMQESLRAFSPSDSPPRRRLARRWDGVRAPATLHAIGVSHDALGRPEFAYFKALEDYMRSAALSAHLSISDERHYVMAFAVIENINPKSSGNCPPGHARRRGFSLSADERELLRHPRRRSDSLRHAISRVRAIPPR